MFKKTALCVIAAAAVILSGCSDGDKAKPAAKPAAEKSKNGSVTAIEGGSDLFEGSGNGEVDIIRFDEEDKPDPESTDPVLIRVTSDGNELSYIGVEADGAKVVDTIGAYDGISVIADGDASTIQITTLDAWTVQFVPMSNAVSFEADKDNGGVMSATGDRPAVLEVPEDITEFTVSFETTEAFAEARPFRIMHLNVDGDIETVLERAGASADGRFSVSGPGHIVVSDIGKWTITER